MPRTIFVNFKAGGGEWVSVKYALPDTQCAIKCPVTIASETLNSNVIKIGVVEKAWWVNGKFCTTRNKQVTHWWRPYSIAIIRCREG